MGHLGKLYGVRANGEEFPIEASISQVQSEQGRFFTVILRDITRRVKAEEKLVENEQQLRATFDQAAVGIAHVSPDGNWLGVNRKLVDILGYSAEELLSLTYKEITYPDDLPADKELHDQIASGKISTYSREKRFFRKDGSLIWGNVTVSQVRDLSGNILYLVKVIEDITARKEAEALLQKKSEEIRNMTQQLWQTAKLATMGELAASIAHELNNPLAILSLRIESLMSSIEPADQKWRELEIMEGEVDRMASLVGNLLQFSRSGQRQVSSLDVRDEITQTLELIHTHLTHRHITVIRDFSPEMPLIQADRQQLRQLFLNLFTNASDAMPDGGELIIKVFPTMDRHKISMQIKDSGIGIPTENLTQVTDPFYTTKPEGKGTGLGLAICRRIVEEHDGSLKISSQGIDQGTTIQIELPGSNETPQFIVEE